ncbi:hypothetical protein [Cryobacterium sp. N22]|uniref:hypothetical protein n=1 Tax=Cryobacterium sp. N22 TaxID=2048290 RepID=UPI000CE3D455|nr:hypothetical protein [Cryobacterium sp. N22]
MSNNTLTVPTASPARDAYANEFNSMVAVLPTYRSTVGCKLPAYNETDSGNDNLVPLLVGLAAAAAMVFIWMQLPIMVQSTILRIGWPILGVTTVLQILTVFFTLFKRHRGYQV